MKKKYYKKYKIPENTREIYLSEDGNPFIFIRKLIQTQDKQWKVIPTLVYLEEIK